MSDRFDHPNCTNLTISWQYGNLHDNLNDLLVHGTPGEIRKKVNEVTDTAKPYGNFILAASDYFTEGTPYENI